VIEPIDLGICDGYEWGGDRDPEWTAIVLPGAMLGGMPVNAFVAAPLYAAGWRVIQPWQDVRRADDRLRWPLELAEAALAYAGRARLVSGKSLGSLAAAFAAERGLAGIWTTPLFNVPQFVDALRARRAPALVVGGTADEAWDGGLAREFASDVCEIAGADHGLARSADAARVEEAVAAFLRGLGPRG
jgi:hypothetical protein